jgi:hypothetical protein
MSPPTTPPTIAPVFTLDRVPVALTAVDDDDVEVTVEEDPELRQVGLGESTTRNGDDIASRLDMEARMT